MIGGVIEAMTIRKWKFFVETDDDSGYLDPNGVFIKEKNDVADWLDTDHEAAEEATRRAVRFETTHNECITRIFYESQGKVKEANEKIF